MAVNDAEIKAFVDQNINSPAVISQAAIDFDISVEDIARATGYSPNTVIDYFKNAGVRVPRTTSIAASQLTDEQINSFIRNNINNPASIIGEAKDRGIYFAEDLARITGFTVLQVRDYFSNAGFVPPPYRDKQNFTDEQISAFINNNRIPVTTVDEVREQALIAAGYVQDGFGRWIYTDPETKRVKEYQERLAALGITSPPPRPTSGAAARYAYWDFETNSAVAGPAPGSTEAALVAAGYDIGPDGVWFKVTPEIAALKRNGFIQGSDGAWYKPTDNNSVSTSTQRSASGGNKLILRLPPQDPLRPGRTNNASGQVPSPGVGAAISREQISSNIERRVPQFQSVGFDKQRIRDEARYGISLESLTNNAYDLQIRALSNPQGYVDVNVRYEYVPLDRNREEAIVIWSLYDLEHIIVGPDIDRDAVREAALEFGISNAELARITGFPENQVSAYLQGLALGPSSDLKNPPGKFLQVIKPSAGAF
jgi:hypothetical protein